jgi:hypothetical protein
MVTKEDLKAERDLLQDMINNVGLYADEEIRKQTKKLETLRKRAESEGVRQEEITETSQADTRKFGRFLQAMAHEARTGETSEELKANRASQRAATGVEAGSPSEGGFLLDRDSHTVTRAHGPTVQGSAQCADTGKMKAHSLRVFSRNSVKSQWAY